MNNVRSFLDTGAVPIAFPSTTTSPIQQLEADYRTGQREMMDKFVANDLPLQDMSLDFVPGARLASPATRAAKFGGDGRVVSHVTNLGDWTRLDPSKGTRSSKNLSGIYTTANPKATALREKIAADTGEDIMSLKMQVRGKLATPTTPIPGEMVGKFDWGTGLGRGTSVPPPGKPWTVGELINVKQYEGLKDRQRAWKQNTKAMQDMGYTGLETSNEVLMFDPSDLLNADMSAFDFSDLVL